jgi:hypothetical protein
MSVEILLLLVLGALTLVAYAIALNSHGTTKLSISYLLATFILVGSVWATVQYVNSGDNRKKMEEFKKLETEKQKTEEKMHSQEAAMQLALRENKERLTTAARLNGIITQGAALATVMINSDVHDMNLELDALVGKASDTKRKSDELASDFEKLKISDTLFTQSSSLVKDALKQLVEAAQYYVLYFRAEDNAQEVLREQVMRQKAANTRDLLQKASSLISPSGG